MPSLLSHFLCLFAISSASAIVSGPVLSLIGVGGAEDVTVQVAADGDITQTATISLSGPDTRWFGVGFDSQIMLGAYAVVVYENGTAVEERILGLHNNGAACNAQTLSVLSNTVLSGVRSLVVTRPLNVSSGTCVGGFDFPGTAASFDVIGGYGNDNGAFATDARMGGHTRTETGGTWMVYETQTAATREPTATPTPAPTRRNRGGGGTPTRGAGAGRGGRGGGGGGGRTPRPVTASATAAGSGAANAVFLVEEDADDQEIDAINDESESAPTQSHLHFIPRDVSDAAAVLLMAVLAVIALSCVAYYLRQRTWKKLPMAADERQPLLSGEISTNKKRIF